MKINKKFFYFSLLSFSSIFMFTSCNFVNNLLTNDDTIGYKTTTVEYDGVEVIYTTKTKLNYTYKDYTENNYYNISSCPTLGNAKILVIPIWFTDSSNYVSYKDNLHEDIEKAYFGSEEDTNWHSVNSYYNTESFGKLNLTGTVSNWYESSYKASYFASDIDSSKTINLVDNAVNWYFENTKENRNDYDSDKDGYIDSVCLIYAAPDYSQSASFEKLGDNLWAYCNWTENDANKYNPSVNCFFFASYDFMYGKNKAMKRVGTSYASGDTTNCFVDAHTYIHEFGHILGLDDYYSYDENVCPAGDFSMQDYNVGGHDPFSVMAFGWAAPYIPTKSCTIELNDFQSSHDLILLSPSFNSNLSPFDEYLLLELYSPTVLNELDTKYQYLNNYPRGVDDVGIRLWHVDSRLISNGTLPFTTNPTDKKVYQAMTNSFTKDYGSILGKKYYKYNLLQLIRNDENIDYKSNQSFNALDLFKTKSLFSIPNYETQFAKKYALNNGQSLGWQFEVSIDQEEKSPKAIIKLYKTK